MDNTNMYTNGSVEPIQAQATSNVAQMPTASQVPAGMTTPINSNESMRVTSIIDLQSYANGTVVRFPDFAKGQPFVARVRRPSMLIMAKNGNIPNSLLSTASELFTSGGSNLDGDNTQLLSDMYDVCHIICEACLIEPSLKDIEATGITLSDEQIMAIFNYTQMGVKALQSFRQE